jgi:hypothetical protein
MGSLIHRYARTLMIAVAAITGLAVGGCVAPASSPASSAGPTAGPAASGTATLAPSDDVSAGPTGSPAGEVPTPSLQPNIVVRIAVAVLNVREEPMTASKVVGAMRQGDYAILQGDFRAQSDGYAWYHVLGGLDEVPELPTPPYSPENDLSGWMAVDNGSTLFVSLVAPRCPSDITLANVSGMLAGERLACFGGRTITLEGTYGCGGCGGTNGGTFDPEWLATPLSPGFLTVDPSVGRGPLVAYFPPNVAAPAQGAIVRVHGHFDDPRAATCKVSVVVGPATDLLTPVPPDDAVLYCRQRFVVESFEVLGTDPRFHGG